MQGNLSERATLSKAYTGWLSGVGNDYRDDIRGWESPTPEDYKQWPSPLHVLVCEDTKKGFSNLWGVGERLKQRSPGAWLVKGGV